MATFKKIIFLKDLKFIDLYRSLLKTERSFVITVSFTFILFILRMHDLQR